MMTLPDFITEPYSLSCWLREHVGYVSDEQRNLRRETGYHWLTPEQTLRQGAGFCYDQAAQALWALQCLGYTKAQLLFVWWGDWGRVSDSGHFICYWQQQKGGYHALDNGWLRGPFVDLAQLISSVAKGRKVKGLRRFEYEQIPFGISYSAMAELCVTEG